MDNKQKEELLKQKKEFRQGGMNVVEGDGLALYERALTELNDRNINKAIWAKAFALSSSDDETKRKYVKLRHAQLMDAAKKQIEALSTEITKIEKELEINAGSEKETSSEEAIVEKSEPLDHEEREKTDNIKQQARARSIDDEIEKPVSPEAISSAERKSERNAKVDSGTDYNQKPSAPAGYLPVEEFATHKNMTPEKAIGMIREGFYVGVKKDNSWYVHAAEFDKGHFKPTYYKNQQSLQSEELASHSENKDKNSESAFKPVFVFSVIVTLILFMTKVVAFPSTSTGAFGILIWSYFSILAYRKKQALKTWHFVFFFLNIFGFFMLLIATPETFKYQAMGLGEYRVSTFVSATLHYGIAFYLTKKEPCKYFVGKVLSR